MGAAAEQLTIGLGGLILIVAVVVFVGVEALLVAAVLRMRRDEATAGSGRPTWVRVNWGWELLWTLLPALGLLALGLLGAQAVLGDRPQAPSSGPLTPVAVPADQRGAAVQIAHVCAEPGR